MSRLSDKLDLIMERIRKEFVARDEAREKVLPLCREVIRHCSQAIRALHRRQFGPARDKLKTAQSLLAEVEPAIAAHNELGNSGFIRG